MKNNRIPTKDHLNRWVYFSQAGLQMAITIAVCSFSGVWLDTKLPNDYSFYIVVCSFVEAIGTMYNIIRGAQQMTDESQP